jgi:hypothetical protein
MGDNDSKQIKEWFRLLVFFAVNFGLQVDCWGTRTRCPGPQFGLGGLPGCAGNIRGQENYLLSRCGWHKHRCT